MLVRALQATVLSLGCAGLIASSGCSECARGCSTKVVTTKSSPCKVDCEKKGPCEKPHGEVAGDLPPNARPGECYAKVWVPPTFKTVTERVCVKEASERIEIVPAEYEWVEERVCVKDASTRLVEVPAEFEETQVTIQTGAAHTDWEVTNSELCRLPNGEVRTVSDKQMTKNVFCLVTYPAQHETITKRCQVRPATVREEHIPAQYETVRREKLVRPATTRRITIPAEYETVTKQVKVCEGRMAWQRVVCEVDGNNASVQANTPVTRMDFDRN